MLLLVPLHALVPQAPAAVSVDTTPLYSKTALSQEVTERPADGVPYMAAPTGYIVPRAELQTGHRTVLERLAVGATRLNLLALAWNLGVLAVALYQFGGYASGASASAAPHSRLTPAGAVPCRRGCARAWSPRRWYAAPWWRARCIPYF